MSLFTKGKRQAIIDGYLVLTGRNLFIPSDFIDWLSGQPEHEAYEWFFAKSDSEAAREYRIGLARRMASGLRIVAKMSFAPDDASVVHITSREYPAYVSPMNGRKNGGGYEPFNPEDPEAIAELLRHGSAALRGWLSRYRGAFEKSGYDLTSIEILAMSQDAQDVA